MCCSHALQCRPYSPDNGQTTCLQAGIGPPSAVLADSACPPQRDTGPPHPTAPGCLQPDAAVLLAAAGAASNFHLDPLGASTWCAGMSRFYGMLFCRRQAAL